METSYTSGQIFVHDTFSVCLCLYIVVTAFQCRVSMVLNTVHSILLAQDIQNDARQITIRFWGFNICVVFACVGQHPLTAGDHYSLFHLTAGLSPATGEHAGKWVTVKTVCLPHICCPSTLSTPGTSRQRPETVTTRTTSQQKSLRWFWVKVQWDDNVAMVPNQRPTPAARRWLRQYSGDEGTLMSSVGRNFQDG